MSTSVVSAAIIEGSLIIGLSDGSVINCGFVQGPQGLSGPQGPMGATGDRGTDGNTILTVAGTPGNEMGTDGDYAIDNINWRIYGPKSGGTWGKAKEMLPGKEMILENGRMTAMTGGGGGGSGSGGTAVERPPIVDDGSNTPPTIYPELPGQPGSNLQQGDMWIDANGSLHFYYNGQWNKVTVYTDKVLASEDAPYLGRIITPNNEIFLTQLDYNEWLYTRTDRRPIVAATAPSIHPDFPAYPLRVGDYWIDSNNHLYYWDGSAWTPIDAGTGRSPIFDANEPTEHPDYSAPDNQLQVGDVWYDTDNNFKQYIWDGTQWVAISTERVEAFTRFYGAVDPASYNSGNDGTCALTASGSTINTITNVKVSGTDGKNKVRYLYQVNEDIVIEDERNGAYAVLRVTVINAAGDYDVELEHYNGVGNIDLGAEYAFGSATDRGVIPDVSDDAHQPGTLDDRYVNKVGGDSMEGPLDVTGGRAPNADGIVSTVKALNIDSGQDSALHLKQNGNTKVYVGDNLLSTATDVKFLTNGLKVKSDTDEELLVVNSNGVFYDGLVSNDRHLVNKEYVDEQIDDLVSQIGGIGSSNKAGVFTWQASGGITPGGWQFEGRTNPDYLYAGLNQINISKVDKAGNTWSVDDFPVNEVLRIEDESDGHFLEGHITAALDGGPASIQVTYTIESANGTADGDQVISVGENLDHKYVERTGDSMVGDLEMQSSRVAFTGMTADEVALQAKRADGEDLTLLKLQNASVSPAVSGFYNIKIEGNTFYNGMRILGGSGAVDTLWEIRGGSGEMKFFGSTDYQHNRLKQVGDAVEDDDALTFGQFKQELADFRDDIIADLSFGTWVYSSNNITPIQTRFYVRATNGSTNAVNPALVDTLIFNVEDINGSIAPFDRVDVGEMFTLSNSGIVAKYRVTAVPVNSGSQNEGRVISVAFISQSQTFSFLQDQTWNVQLTEFAEITVDALDDTYLRLDTTNDPLETQLEIKTSSFGEAKLTLHGKRDNSNNSCAGIVFENEDESGAGKEGHISYFTKGTSQRFEFNQNVYLKGGANLSFADGGSILHNNGPRITFNSASNGNEGSGLVVFTRPGNVARRGVVLKGKYIKDAGTDDEVTVPDGDFFFSYTNNDEDAINYMGKTSGANNIQTYSSVQANIAAALEDIDELKHTPFISNGDGTVVGVYASTVTKKQVAGFFSGGSNSGSRNQYVGNFNSYLKCGHEVIAIQSGANNYANLDVGYDLEFSGIVTVINRNGGGVLYKNVCTRVQCAQTTGEEPHVKIWVRDAIGSSYGNKPMFAFGEITDWTNVSVIIEGYYLG